MTDSLLDTFAYPTKWKNPRLKYLAKLVAGGTPSTTRPDYWRWSGEGGGGGGVPWVGIGDITAGDPVRTTEKRVTQAGLDAARLTVAPPGTLLFSMYASLGEVAETSIPCCWNQAILEVLPDARQLDQRFLKYVLRSLRPVLKERARSNTQMNLNAEQVGNLPIPCPRLWEQRRLADFLDHELGILASSESRLRRLRLLLGERLAASWSSRLHCGRLLNVDVGLPAGWGLIRLKFLALLQSGVTLGKSYLVSGLVDRPYLRVANVQDGRLDLADVSTIAVPEPDASRYELRPGDVLMTEGGDNDKLGRGTVWNGEIAGCLHQNHVFAVRPDRTKLRPQYLAAVMASTHGKAYFQSTAHQTTNLASTNSAKLMNFPIPLPPAEEQDRLLQELQAGRNSTARLDTLLRQQLALLFERRDALISAAVTGQLDPSSYRASPVAA